MTRKDVKGDQPSGGETNWTYWNDTIWQMTAQDKVIGDDMLRPSPNHGTQRLPNDDDDELLYICYSESDILSVTHVLEYNIVTFGSVLHTLL